MRLKSYESVIASRLVFSRKIRRPAIFDFCNTIGTTRKWLGGQRMSAVEGQTGHAANARGGLILTAAIRFAGLRSNHSFKFGRIANSCCNSCDADRLSGGIEVA